MTSTGTGSQISCGRTWPPAPWCTSGYMNGLVMSQGTALSPAAVILAFGGSGPWVIQSGFPEWTLYGNTPRAASSTSGHERYCSEGDRYLEPRQVEPAWQSSAASSQTSRSVQLGAASSRSEQRLADCGREPQNQPRHHHRIAGPRGEGPQILHPGPRLSISPQQVATRLVVVRQPRAQDAHHSPVVAPRPGQVFANDLHVLEVLATHPVQVLPLDVMHGHDAIGEHDAAGDQPRIQLPILAVSNGGIEAAQREKVIAIDCPRLLKQVARQHGVEQFAAVRAIRAVGHRPNRPQPVECGLFGVVIAKMDAVHHVLQFVVGKGGPRLGETPQESHQGLDTRGQHVVVVVEEDEHVATCPFRAPVPGKRRIPPLGTVATCTSG